MGFREMRRSKQAVSNEECIDMLKNEKRGVLSVIGDKGYPYGVPVNFYYDEADGKIYFHGAKEGHKLDAIKRCNKVCFTTWGGDYKKEGDWAWYVTSVIAMGRAELITDRDLTNEKLRLLGDKYFPSADETEATMQRSAARTQLIAMEIEHMTGKLVHER